MFAKIFSRFFKQKQQEKVVEGQKRGEKEEKSEQKQEQQKNQKRPQKMNMEQNVGITKGGLNENKIKNKQLGSKIIQIVGILEKIYSKKLLSKKTSSTIKNQLKNSKQTLYIYKFSHNTFAPKNIYLTDNSSSYNISYQIYIKLQIHLPNLKILNLSQFNLSSIQHLSYLYLPNLLCLQLYQNNLRSINSLAKNGIPKLKTLTLYKNQIVQDLNFYRSNFRYLTKYQLGRGVDQDDDEDQFYIPNRIVNINNKEYKQRRKGNRLVSTDFLFKMRCRGLQSVLMEDENTLSSRKKMRRVKKMSGNKMQVKRFGLDDRSQYDQRQDELNQMLEELIEETSVERELNKVGRNLQIKQNGPRQGYLQNVREPQRNSFDDQIEQMLRDL